MKRHLAVRTLTERVAHALIAGDDRPRRGALFPPDLAVDEVGDAPEAEPERRHAGDAVAEAHDIDSVAAAKQDRRQDHADEAAVKVHPALPDVEDPQWVVEDVGRLLQELDEDNPSQPSADQHAKRRPNQEVVDVGRRGDGDAGIGLRPQGGLGHDRPQVEPAEDQARDIGERIPTNAEGAPEMNELGVEVRKRDRGEVHGGADSEWRGDLKRRAGKSSGPWRGPSGAPIFRPCRPTTASSTISPPL